MENSTKHTCSESILIERSSVTWYCATEVMMAEKPSSFTFGELAREPLGLDRVKLDNRAREREMNKKTENKSALSADLVAEIILFK